MSSSLDHIFKQTDFIFTTIMWFFRSSLRNWCYMLNLIYKYWFPFMVLFMFLGNLIILVLVISSEKLQSLGWSFGPSRRKLSLTPWKIIKRLDSWIKQTWIYRSICPTFYDIGFSVIKVLCLHRINEPYCSANIVIPIWALCSSKSKIFWWPKDQCFHFLTNFCFCTRIASVFLRQ